MNTSDNVAGRRAERKQVLKLGRGMQGLLLKEANALPAGSPTRLQFFASESAIRNFLDAIERGEHSGGIPL